MREAVNSRLCGLRISSWELGAGGDLQQHFGVQRDALLAHLRTCGITIPDTRIAFLVFTLELNSCHGRGSTRASCQESGRRMSGAHGILRLSSRGGDIALCKCCGRMVSRHRECNSSLECWHGKDDGSLVLLSTLRISALAHNDTLVSPWNWRRETRS